MTSLPKIQKYFLSPLWLITISFGMLHGQDSLSSEGLFLKIDELKNKGDFSEIIKIADEYASVFEKTEAWDNFFKLQLSQVNAFRSNHDFDGAKALLTDLQKKALRHLKPDSQVLAQVYKTLGELYVDDMLLYNKGLGYYEKCLGIEENYQNKYNPELVTAYNNIAMTHKLLGDFDKAKEYHHKALKIVSNSTDDKLHHNTLYYLGDLNVRILEYDSAKKCYAQALTIWEQSDLPHEHTNLADTYKGLGWVYSGNGDYKKAIKLELKALSIYEKIDDIPEEKLGHLHIEISYEYQQIKDYDQALQHTRQAYILYQKVYKKDHPGFGAVYHSLGHIYYGQAQYFNMDVIDKSITQYQALLRNDSINYPELDNPTVAVDFHAMGLAYKWAGEYRKAMDNIMMTLKIQRHTFGEESLRLINTINNIGAVYVDLKKYDSARYYFNEALRICKNQDQLPTLDLLNIHKNFADVYIFEKKFDLALTSINRSLSYFDIHPGSHENLILPPLDSINFKQNLIYVLPRRAKALMGLYHQTKDPKYLTLTLSNDLLLSQVYIHIIQNSSATNGQLQQIPSLVSTYERAIFCQSELFKISGNDLHKEAAYNFAEKGKAVLLMKNIKENQALQSFDLPKKVQLVRDSLKRKMNELATQMYSMNITPNSIITSGESKSQAELLKTRSRYQDLENNLVKRYPGFIPEPLGFTAKVSEIQQSLKRNEGVLEYVVGDEDIYSFLITHDGLEMVILNSDSGKLKSDATNFREAILTKDIKKFAVTAHALYVKLFQPFEKALLSKQVDHVTIVADGFLSYIPFEAFIRKIPEALNYKNFDYLLRDYYLNYNYSASLMLDQLQHDNPSGSDVLAFAPTFTGKSSQGNLRNAATLSDLPYAQNELKHVFEHMSGKGYIGKSATETTFKKVAGNYKILHLATHALTDDHRPDLSCLYFSTTDSLNDGQLHAYELYDLKLNAKLVTLSACNTGTGKFYKGEGIASLARAFRYAGCKNIIMSLWAVADRSTSEIMDNFYTTSEEDMRMPDALHEAKLTYLEQADANTADPYFWAGFVFMGNPSSTPDSDNLWIFIVIGAGLIIAALAFYTIKRKPSRQLQ